MKRAAIILPFLLLVSFAFDAEANRVKPAKNQKLSAYAKTRARGKDGKFARVPARFKVIKGSLRGNGRANPASTGSSTAEIDFKPATRARAGNVVVKIPEMYIGSSTGGTKTQRQLFATDIHGNSVPITGTLEVASSRSGFAKATFRGTVPAGARLSQGGVEQALRGLQVHQPGLSWKPLAGAE